VPCIALSPHRKKKFSFRKYAKKKIFSPQIFANDDELEYIY